jgi:hypothetical protein
LPTTTYDPILEVRDLPRVRVLNPVAAPQLGTALVLEQKAGAPLVVHAGEAVPEARLGAYRRSFLIDLGQYGLQLDEQLPSADPAFLFTCLVTFSCRVRDPALVASRNIRDMTAAVRLPLVRIIRSVARNFDIAQFNAAEVALNDELCTYTGDAAVELGSYLVELVVGGGAATSGAEFHDVAREARLDAIRRREMDGVATSREEMIKQWLIKNGGDPSELIALDAESKRIESENLLRAIGLLSSSDTDEEPFDTKAEKRRLLGSFIEKHGGSVDGERPVRRRRLGGSLAPESPADSAPPTETKARTDEKPPEKSAPEERRSRVRGVQQGPLPGTGRGARLRDPDADDR